MKTVWKISMATGLLAGSVWIGSILNITAEGASVGSQPGTADDPVVTKSYVDQQIQKAIQGGTIATQTPTATATPVATAAPSSPAPSNNEVIIVDVKPGQTLIAGAGAEFIVRAGKAVIYSQDSNGVADLTDGTDLANGLAAPSNHLLSFPRDGRGITVQEGQTLGLVVMVRGSYTLK
ncbi:hypothetical protein [Paenibacillus pedocola]|uniref:hypothetical protein n=1 Tax=Paenibacillus pedocola TaxID=3242193 RepID=UPI0028778994|nr:hypothetical protein [Paenibacillus typhae]